MVVKSDKTNQYSSPVGAIFTGISDLFKQSGDKLDLKDLPSLEGKTGADYRGQLGPGAGHSG